MEIFAPVNMLMETKAAGSLGNLLGGLCAYMGKSFMLYQNTKETILKYQYPGVSGESISAKTSDNVSLSGHLFWPESAENRKDLPTVIFFHENAGTIGQRLEYFGNYVIACHCNLIVFGYRGYSKSSGHPSSAGIKNDTEAILSKVFSTLGDKINLEKVVVHGKSLGGGAASYIVSQEQWKDRIRGVVLDSTFNSVGSLVSYYIPALQTSSDHIFANEKWDVVENATKFRENMPVLIIGVVNDEICPYQHSQTLHSTLKSLDRPATLLTYEEGGHNDFCYTYRDQYLSDLRSFIDKL